MLSNPYHRSIRHKINTYFDFPLMKKIRNDNDKSIYMCRIHSLLLNDNRYIIVLCNLDDFPIGVNVKIQELPWDCIQIRKLENSEFLYLTPHMYEIKRDLSYLINVTRTYQSDQYSIYSCKEYPIRITLLNTIKDQYEYPNTGTLLSCIETYQTIIYLM